MNISAPFVRRPIATSLLAAAVLLAGMAAYLQLPVAPLPRVDFPTIQVQASAAGRQPRDDGLGGGDAARAALRPHRRPHRDDLGAARSATRRSRCSSTSIATSPPPRATCRRRSTPPAAELPANLPTRPNYRKVNPADAPILILALTSETLPLAQVFDAANTRAGPEDRPGRGRGAGVRRRRAAARGARAGRSGGAGRAWAWRSRTCARRWRASTANQPKGSLDGPGRPLHPGRQRSAARRRRLPQRWSSPTRTAPACGWATSPRSSTTSRTTAWPPGSNGERAVLLIIRRQPGREHPRDHRRHQGAAAARCSDSISPAIDVTLAIDRTTHHPRVGARRRADAAHQRRCWWSLVVFVFLRSVRATAIPSVAVPLSLVGTFGVMYLLDYSLDNLSLMALTISTGFVVDDAIVVTENIAAPGRGGQAAAAGGARGGASRSASPSCRSPSRCSRCSSRSCSWAGSSAGCSASSR